MSESKLTAAKAHAARQRRLNEVLAELGLTHPEHALFIAVQYHIHVPPERLPCIAEGEHNAPGNGALVTEEECRTALARCFVRGWLRVIDDSALAGIHDDLRRGAFLGPIYGLPPVGTVDFTPTGAELWLRLHKECERTAWCTSDRPPFAYSCSVHAKSAWYFRTLRAALNEIDQVREEEDFISARGPTPTGPWRAQWWRRFPKGYRIDVEGRGKGFCSSGEGESCHLRLNEREHDPRRLSDVLDRHNVTFVEWLILSKMEHGPRRFRDPLDFTHLHGFAQRVYEASLSLDELRDALQACLRNDWLRALNLDVIEEVHSLLRYDPTFLALPQTAELAPTGWYLDPTLYRLGMFVKVPAPPESRWGQIDFSPAGAQLYRMISAEWLGPDWEDDLLVSNCYYREVHYYCESRTGFEHVANEDEAWGNIRARRHTPIGPWCVAWWQRFSSGYKLELEIGNPDGP